MRLHYVALLIASSRVVCSLKSPASQHFRAHFSKFTMSSSSVMFGPWQIQPSQVFYESNLSLGIVNLKPLVPGHVLVIPKRVVARFADLTPNEVSDIYAQVHRISPVLERHYGCSAANIAMQDGSDAGQSVPHVHVHILPRKKDDFEKNDDVYEELEEIKLDESFRRPPRTQEAMKEEADELRALF